MSPYDITGSIFFGLLTTFLWGTAHSLNSKPDQLGTNADAAECAWGVGLGTFAAFIFCILRLMGEIL